MDKKKNNWLLIILIFIVVGIVFLFPTIYKFTETLSLPKIEKEAEEEEVIEKKLDDSIVDDLHFPIMRNSIYESKTYYSLSSFSISDMTNSDILFNAFLDIYTGNLTNYGSYGCTNNSKQFSEDYMTLRIKNIIGKDVSYSLDNFYVYEGSNTSYAGEWVYDSGSKSFIYKGLCSSRATAITYYDLKEFIKAEYDKSDIVVHYYVGFAKVEGNNYTIYSDANMENQISSGTLSTPNELNDLFKSIDKKNKKTYKFIFNNTLCSYNEYCLSKGEWY